jgi:hypothetical protein
MRPKSRPRPRTRPTQQPTARPAYRPPSGASSDAENILAAALDYPALLQAAIKSTATPEEVLLALRHGNEWSRPFVSQAVVRYVHSDRRILDLIAHDPVTEVREHAAIHKLMPPHLLRHLATDPEASVRRSVAWNPATPTPTRLSLSFDPVPEVVAETARKTLPRWRVNQLADHPEIIVRKSLAGRAHLTHTLMEKLSRDPEPQVRAALALRMTTVRITRRLARDPDPIVRRGLIGGAHIRSEVAVMIAAIPSVKVRCELLRDPAVSLKVLQRFRDDRDPAVRAIFEERRHEELPGYSVEECLRW